MTRVRSQLQRSLVVISMCASVYLLAPSAEAQQSYLQSGQSLPGNGYLVSANKAFFAQVRSAGNFWPGSFAIYKGSGPAQNFGRIWSTGKPDTGSAMTLAMQTDGNLCVYPQGSGSPYWCKDFIARPSGDYFAVMQDDGNLCIYKGTPAAQGAGVWCTSSNMAVTWSIGKQYKFLPAGQSVVEALTFNGYAIDSGRDMKDVNSFWSVAADSSMRLAADSTKCVTVAADNSLSLQQCGASGNQTGWRFVPSVSPNGTLRYGSTGCMEFAYDSRNWRDGAAMPKKLVLNPTCSSSTTFSQY